MKKCFFLFLGLFVIFLVFGTEKARAIPSEELEQLSNSSEQERISFYSEICYDEAVAFRAITDLLPEIVHSDDINLYGEETGTRYRSAFYSGKLLYRISHLEFVRLEEHRLVCSVFLMLREASSDLKTSVYKTTFYLNLEAIARENSI